MAGRIEQVRKPNSRYQIGSGKVKELAKLIKEKNAQKIVFDNLLKPVQAYNLAKSTGVEAIDRFQLILEIFVRRASTTEAKFQIQLAKLGYELAHAKEKVRLARMEEQPGFMGLGAYEVDVYYEAVKRQIQTIREKLRKVRKKRVLHRKRRVELGFSSISLAGYTNAGKSSLFNALTEEEALVDTALFTTLSTKTRLVKLSKKRLLLTDTVGFIDRLPLTLIEAFHSTLEETIFSDLILLVVDSSEPMSVVEKKFSCCMETIERIGAFGIPIVTALNKIDLLRGEEIQQRLESLKERVNNLVPISALYGTNLDLLKRRILKIVKNYIRASFSVPMTNESMSFVSWLFNRSDVKAIEYTDKSAHMVFEATPWFAETVKNKVQEFHGKFKKVQVTKA